MTWQFSLAGLLVGILVGLVLVLGALGAYGLNAWMARPRPAAARSFD